MILPPTLTLMQDVLSVAVRSWRARTGQEVGHVSYAAYNEIEMQLDSVVREHVDVKVR